MLSMVNKKLLEVCNHQSMWHKYLILYTNGSFKQQYMYQIRQISKWKLQQMRRIQLKIPALIKSIEHDHDYLIKALLVGDVGTGKRLILSDILYHFKLICFSSLIQRYMYGTFNKCYELTIGVNFELKRIKMGESKVKLQVILFYKDHLSVIYYIIKL